MRKTSETTMQRTGATSFHLSGKSGRGVCVEIIGSGAAAVADTRVHPAWFDRIPSATLYLTVYRSILARRYGLDRAQVEYVYDRACDAAGDFSAPYGWTLLCRCQDAPPDYHRLARVPIHVGVVVPGDDIGVDSGGIQTRLSVLISEVVAETVRDLAGEC